MDTRRPLRWLRAWGFEQVGRDRRASRRLDGSCAAVLMYHRVIPREQAHRLHVEPGMYVTPRTFERHLEWLESGFRVLPLSEIVDCLAANRSLPRAACAITFDDGWRDNHEHALPALAARGLPATVFAVTDRVGTSGAFWPDELSRRLSAAGQTATRALAAQLGAPPTSDPSHGILEHLKRLPALELERALEELRERTPGDELRNRQLMDWNELAGLAQAGIEVESHAATHAILTSLDPDDAGRELSRSLDSLRSRGLARGALLAYPSGNNDARVRSLAAAAGYRAAFTTVSGVVRSGSDLFALSRFGLHDDISRTFVEFSYSIS